MSGKRIRRELVFALLPNEKTVKSIIAVTENFMFFMIEKLI